MGRRRKEGRRDELDLGRRASRYGDSKWAPNVVPVKPNTYYTFSDWYKSNASTAVGVCYELDTDTLANSDADKDGVIDGHSANLCSGIARAPDDWIQEKTGFTMPANTARAHFVHFIARDGWLQTDDYFLREEAAQAGFSKPMVNLTFDDGSQGFWDERRQPLKDKGFETTQYTPSLGLTDVPHDPFVMSEDEVPLAREGNEIGGHSVTHPSLPGGQRMAS